MSVLVHPHVHKEEPLANLGYLPSQPPLKPSLHSLLWDHDPECFTG